MDSILVDESDLLIVSLLDPSLKENAQLAPDVSDTSDQPHHHQISPAHGDADIDNVFEFQQFIDGQASELSETQNGKNTMEALKMIDLHALEVENQTHRSNTEYSGESEVGESLTPGSIVHVEYNPNEKVKRLGRPRKHLNGMPSPAPGESASDNLEKATISKFRFDERPIEGPGSRGGDPLHHRKGKGKLTESPALKKRKQALLNFSKSDASTSLLLLTSDNDVKNGSDDVKKETIDKKEMTEKEEKKGKKDMKEKEAEISVSETNDGDMDIDLVSAEVLQEENQQEDRPKVEPNAEGDSNGKETEPKPETIEISSQVTEEENTAEPPKKRARPTRTKKTPAKKPAKETKKETSTKEKDNKIKKLTLSFKPKASRTTIVREKNRVTRTYPGPLIPIHYDLYDDNLISATANKATSSEELALGFPIKSCPYLDDIIFLIGFLSKFDHIVDVGVMGPEDLEIGLGLVNDNPEIPARVAPAMDVLFRRLLALVLNRKKPILLSMQRTAIQELRGQYIGLGLPEEWRDDSHIRVVTSLPCDPVKDRVDTTKPEVSSADNIEYQAPAEKMNPFLEPEFEEFGLLGIEKPIDRLIMLRCLATWSLSASNQLKTYLTKIINGQDIPGERDTMYGSRAVLKGFNQTTELKKELELKISKKNKSQLTPKGTPDPDTISRYIDPTSDPLAHPMALRFNEFLVGDCGFHIGRFYLVRMADATSGAISSIEKMKSLAKDAARVRSSIPSNFKLYVEDVHQMLTDWLPVLGPEFDDTGNEVPTTASKHSLNWHVVASNAGELHFFLNHVGSRLGLLDGDKPIMSLGSLAYKPLLHMYHYLSLIQPLLEEFEKLEVTGVGEIRTSRKKKVNYSAAKEPEWNEDEEDQEEYGHVDVDDDDDYDEFEEGDAEEYVE